MTPKRLKQLRSIFNNLSHCVDRTGDSRALRWFDEAYQSALKGERQHRAMGRSFTRGAATYLHSMKDAGRFFVCKWVLEPAVQPKSWADACDWREDARLCGAVRCVLDQCPDPDGALAALVEAWKAGDFEYVRDFVGEGPSHIRPALR